MKNINFVPIGGMDEKGKNLYVLEVEKNIFIFDIGSKNPSFQNFGVDLIIPNLNYLVENQERIKGLFISNGHPENIGAISYLIRNVKDIPIFGSPATCSILENEFRKMKINKYNINVVNHREDIKIGSLILRPFQVGSHFPESYGYAISDGKEQIVYAANYQMHNDEENNIYKSDFQRMKEIAMDAKTIAFISESSKAKEEGFSKHNNKGIINGFKKIINPNKKQKILVGAFYSDIKSIQEMIEFAQENKKRIIIYGRALNEIIKYLTSNNLIKLDEKSLLSFTKIESYDNYVIFACHTSYNLYRKLKNIVSGEDSFVKLAKDMEVYIAAWPIPGAETFYYKLIDAFYKFGIRAKYVDKNFVKGASPFKNDIKYMLDTFTPNSVIAIKGKYRELNDLNNLAISSGIKEDLTTLLDNGEELTITSDKIKKSKKKIGIVDSIVDGNGVGDIGKTIVDERIRMGDSGAVFIGIMLKANSKKLATTPTIELVGLTENQEYIEIINNKLNSILEEILPGNTQEAKKFDIKSTKAFVRKKITNLCRRKLNKEPVVVPMIIEVR